ncbi:hypothetical protein COX93_00470 [Candidatus Nomurabacteria bacterium CG_4_10_14_0_2_um_filter_30_12]|uniref:Uncharacterized protein n=1 Tax=Candidatus Nomurabacteria bacterium CG_4_10_14_0_2_um_filter_30_12 TaxID=1974727 RepID=A0A2J0MGI0_9BACT|nr:MAG: hypothetical protein COX93_00470 [Candidatus Nomurabacteria bacterium CG_4_10_14_0_2_um_filter_30_12]
MENIKKLEKALTDFKDKVIPLLNSLKVEAKKLDLSIPEILDSWSGSWFGYQSKLYYGNFEKPPVQDKFSVEWGSINGLSNKWKERKSEEVKRELEKISYVSVDELEREYKSLLNIVEDFYDETSLIIKTDAGMQEEISKENLLEGQKKLIYGEEGTKYLKTRQPPTFMTRDSEAMIEGIFAPAILYYESFAKEILNNVELVYKNIKSLHYFIKWMKGKKSPPPTKSEETEQPTSLYITDGIIEAIKQKNDGFNYKKLLKLINELNKNHLDLNVFSSFALIRAITDNVPPLLGFETFEELANNYKGKRTDKDYMFNLLKDRPVSDDALHRPISKSEDLLDMLSIPNKQFLNRLLQECINNTVTQGFMHPKAPKKEKQQPTPVRDSSLRPLITVAITSLRGGPDGYFAEFDLTNAGKGLAILKSITLGEVVVSVLTSTLSEKEKCHVITGNLEGTGLREGSIIKPTLEIAYENFNKEIFKTTYNVELESRDDKKYNIGKFTDPIFTDN